MSPTEAVNSTTEMCGSASDDAVFLINSGKRNLLVGDVPKAVSELSEACELLASKFGETGEECGEAYLYYGKALLEMGRMENNVLGNALEGVDMDAAEDTDSLQVEDPEKLTAEEKLEVEEKVAEALGENFDKFDKIAKIHMGTDDCEDDSAMDEDDSDTAGDKKTTMEDELPQKTSEMSIDDNVVDKEPGDNGEDGEKDEGEAGNLQLAWEMLELAKNAFMKTAEKSSGEERQKAMSMACTALLGLGEVSLENENYNQAVEDFTLCLQKRKASLPADSRSIAEVHYQLGMAQGFLKEFVAAETNLNSAIAVLKARESNLKKMEASDNLDQELEDLDALVTEIRETIAEHKEMANKKEETVGFSGSGDGKAINSISIKKAEGNLVEMAKVEDSAGPATA